MPEYKKKKVQLKNGTSYFKFYKIYANGKKKEVTKEEYTKGKKTSSKKGGAGSCLANNNSQPMTYNKLQTNCIWSGYVKKENRTFPYGISTRFISFRVNPQNYNEILVTYGESPNKSKELPLIAWELNVPKLKITYLSPAEETIYIITDDAAKINRLLDNAKYISQTQNPEKLAQNQEQARRNQEQAVINKKARNNALRAKLRAAGFNVNNNNF